STRPEHLLPLFEKTLGQFAMPSEQVIGQHVGPDFLSGAGLSQQVAHILAFSFLRSLFVEKLVETRSHTTLESERKRRRRERKNDQQDVKACQERRHQRYRHDIARQSQDRPREVSGSPVDLTLGARETIVPVGVIEVTDVHL